MFADIPDVEEQKIIDDNIKEEIHKTFEYFKRAGISDIAAAALTEVFAKIKFKWTKDN